MATIIDPENAQDVDQPLNTDPDYRVTHVFSTDDVTGTFDGLRQGDVADGDMPVVDFSADPTVTKDGVELYPINSEFGYHVTDLDPPPLKWSAVMFRKTEDQNGYEETQAGRDCHEAAAG